MKLHNRFLSNKLKGRNVANIMQVKTPIQINFLLLLLLIIIFIISFSDLV